MKHKFYAVYIQERESVKETWLDAYDPEPYDIFSSLKEAREVKKELSSNKNPLHRVFIRKGGCYV